MQLIIVLMMIDRRTEAEEVQTTFAELVEDIRTYGSEVTSEPLMSSRISADGEGMSISLNTAVVDMFKGSDLLV